MIYIVEDDDNIRELAGYTLSSLHFDTAGFPDSETFEKALKKELPQLVILDLMLPGKDGLTILKELRAQPKTAHLPVLILSAKDSEFDKVMGLNLGADDYLTKPFGAMELAARVNALLRRASKSEEAVAKKAAGGRLIYQPNAHQFVLDGEPLALTSKEFDLLRLFIQYPKKAFSREQLLADVWGYHYDGESRTVDVHIGSLRQKLGEIGESIHTIRGFGYRWQETAGDKVEN
ncbi:MAG: response regulator transcription factor [Enterococcaceae bacterium]|nr:response regulator transcription factor [Enterococcaceae bacterium]MCI1919234.1 response regulator transcription factor [Enterococcaceae bacterium]